MIGVDPEMFSHRRPFTGAWIETDPESSRKAEREVAPSQGRGLKPDEIGIVFQEAESPLHRGVD